MYMLQLPKLYGLNFTLFYNEIIYIFICPKRCEFCDWSRIFVKNIFFSYFSSWFFIVFAAQATKQSIAATIADLFQSTRSSHCSPGKFLLFSSKELHYYVDESFQFWVKFHLIFPMGYDTVTLVRWASSENIFPWIL